MALIALLRGELLDTWQNQLPKDAPNYFALNILPADKEAFGAHLMTLQARAAPLYPVIPGRLISINGEPRPTDAHTLRAQPSCARKYTPLAHNNKNDRGVACPS